jgi:mRNA interferase HicA
MTGSHLVKGHEFALHVKRLGKLTGTRVYFVYHGKGSHGRLYYGERFTTLKDRKQEIGKGLLFAMCKQLDIRVEELVRAAS